MDTTTKRIVIIGNGMVGYKLCEKLVSKGLNSQFEILVFGEEPHVAYDRVHLSAYFEHHSLEELTMAPRSWYEENNITLKTSAKVTGVTPQHKQVITEHGESISYDYLVFATGSEPFVPPIDGRDKDGVFVYRTIEDLDEISAYAKGKKKGVVIGGGLLGLEAAKALIDLNLEAHVVEFAPRLMPRQLDGAASDVLKEKIEDIGAFIHLNKNTSLIAGSGKVTSMEFVDGTSLETDMIVVSAGIKPRDELARQAEIEVGPRGGIVVNDLMQTSAEDIFAIGECALHEGMIYGLVAPGYDMAEVVAEQMLGSLEKSFTGFDMSTKLKLIGIDVASFGDAFGEAPEAEGCKTVVYENKAKGIYKKILVSSDLKLLLGGMLVGDASEYNMLLQMVNNKMPLPEDPAELILPSKSGESADMGVTALPDEALVCSCESVSKGDICCAVKDKELFDYDLVKASTKAGSGCGGCAPLVKDLISDTMKKMGKTVKKSICEHFDYSRQELFDIIKVRGYKTFEEVLENLGEGDGCEICKPLTGSILASIWNEMVLENARDTIQDTNDRFLANIQRGGTYSVVPRVPGGEITPDKLIVLGEVAKKYNLYCKITGGQRIDLFGAQLHELPLIWEELVNAGFETGQAYGKSVRTVKSCVGSTWCRYGVQDSVSMAIQVEERYKGLRSPHKLKFAFSGCVRECAEAQCKDVGAIATEKGWNLYVAGNGGAKPQHAVLFASDIDDETLIKYIDRFLMFYVRTAEPLTRTATWFNKLEGGLDYLKDVIINDSLGICEQLEAEMQHQVDTFHCEWKKVVESPELRAKFKHFVNSDDQDETLEFVEMRGQKFPAPW